jgi:hypothetical protein
MPAISESLRHYAVGIGVSLVFALGVAFYVLLYLPQQEAFLRLRYFRVLERIGHNLQQRSTAFGKRNEAVQRRIVYRAHQIVDTLDTLAKNKQVVKKDSLWFETTLKQAANSLDNSLDNLRNPDFPPRFSRLDFPAAPLGKPNPKLPAPLLGAAAPPKSVGCPKASSCSLRCPASYPPK